MVFEQAAAESAYDRSLEPPEGFVTSREFAHGADVILSNALTVMGASAGMFFVVDPAAGKLRLLRSRGHAPATALAFAQIALKGCSFGSEAIEKRSPVMIEQPSDLEARCPTLAHAADHVGSSACACVPLVAETVVVGLLVLSFSEARHFTSLDRAWLRALTELGALALHRRKPESPRLQVNPESAARHKDDFIAMLGHELRNPLAAIRSAVLLWKTAEPDAARASSARNVIDRQSLQMSRLVDDLLDVSRIVRSKLRLRCKTLDLAVLVGSILDEYRDAVSQKGLRLSFAVRGAQPLLVHADSERFNQILENLLSNALKFTPPPGTIDVELVGDELEVRLLVRDSGIGMDAEVLEALFEPFWQAQRGLDRADGGLGLGLALVRGLVELHGGRVSAHSEGLGTGSEFVIVLPRTAVPLDTQPEAAVAERGAPRRVLIVEDNQDAALMLRELLELVGHETAVAHRGSQALSLVRSFEPDIVLCDIGLPGKMSGYDVARAVRSEGYTGIFMAALTGYGRPEDRQAALEAGFDEHLTKPVDFDTLRKVLDQASDPEQAE